jgi:hypothetical protein
MIALLATFFSNPARIAAGVILAGMLGLTGYLKLELVASSHEVKTLQAAALAQSETVGQLRQSLAIDASALQKYADLAKAAQDAQAAAKVQAALVAKANAKALAALQSAPIPKDCEGARTWAVGTAKDISAGWSK